MASSDKHKPPSIIRKTKHWRELFSSEMIAFSWAPVVLLCACHYFTGNQHHWLHDIYSRLYYFPIIFAALHRGLWGGITLSIAVSSFNVPHAFYHYFELDPATNLEKLLELFIYNMLGILCGILADREEARRRETNEARTAEQYAHQKLERAQRLASLGELVAGIAHEIKNPLHTIQGAAEILDNIVPSDKPQSEMWNIIKQELKRLERVADRFLSFAKPTAPTLALITLDEILLRVSELIEAQASKNKVNLIVEKQLKNDACFIHADKDQVMQVLIDIAINGFSAMEHSSNREMIIFPRVENLEGKEYVVISIQNSGPPIPEDQLESIFDPFFTTRSSGTGLGLSTAARIVAQHHGFIQAQNLSSDEGVIFRVCLPLAKKERSAS